MRKFKEYESGYLEWHEQNKAGFVFNHFGGNNPGYNVLHRSTCTFLWRDKDENSRTTVEKWCSVSENEIAKNADEIVGENMWKRCGICFRRSPQSSIKSAVEIESKSNISDVNREVVGSEVNSGQGVWVPGEPAAWLGSGEQEWKSNVASRLRKNPVEESPQWIEIEFRLTENRLYSKDIDNLITPVLESGREAGWIQQGFNQLGSVSARKVVAAHATLTGAQVIPHAMPPQLSDVSSDVLIETVLDRLDENSVKWALYDRAFQMFSENPDLRFGSGLVLAMDIRVTIDDSKRRKSLKALMKPCIDGVEPILGTPDGRLPVPRTELSRYLAPQDEMIAILDFHVRGGNQNHIAVAISVLGDN
ncbi:hypothetical protein OAK85_05085 [Mariniblastus sp.]|nr:hypothetical protein [Mariniblastus sp.]